VKLQRQAILVREYNFPYTASPTIFFSEDHKNGTCESKNPEMLRCKWPPPTTKIISKVLVQIFLHKHASIILILSLNKIIRNIFRMNWNFSFNYTSLFILRCCFKPLFARDVPCSLSSYHVLRWKLQLKTNQRTTIERKLSSIQGSRYFWAEITYTLSNSLRLTLIWNLTVPNLEASAARGIMPYLSEFDAISNILRTQLWKVKLKFAT
jgi:hypothetical protein